MRLGILLVLLASAVGWAASPGATYLQYQNGSGLPTTASQASPYPVQVVGGAGTSNVVIVNPSSSPVPIYAPSPLSVSGSVVVTSVSSPVPIGAIASPLPAGTNLIGQVTIPSPVPIGAIASPLPTGANTLGAVTQASGPWTQNVTQVGGSAVSLGSKTSANSIPVVIASDQSSQNVVVTSVASPVPIGAIASPLPAGTNALGSVTVTNNVAVGAIASPLPSGTNTIGTVGTTAAINANSTLSARQSVNGTETNLAAPANAVGVLVECESGNSDNLRYGFSNSTGAILSTTLGVLCEPGRDSGFLPLAAGNYLHMIAVTTASSDYIDVQWIKSQ